MKKTVSYNEWLDIDELEDYLDGKLDAKAMHRVEKLSLEDPFVAEALAGLSQSPKRTQSLSLLQKQLAERIAQKPIEKKKWAITSQRLSIASAAAVLFIAVCILFWMKGSKRQDILAVNEPKKVDVTIAPQVAKEKTDTNSVLTKEIVISKPAIAKSAPKKETDKVTLIKNAQIVATNDEAIVASSPIAARMADQKAAAQEVEVITLAKEKKEVQARSSVTALPSKAEGITPGQFKGKVVSKDTGMPIEGAIVRLEGSDRGTTTDRKGEFKLVADSTQNQTLTVGYSGFSTTAVGAKSNQPVNVLLEVNKNSLITVVASKNNVTPLGGWDNYQKYLKANHKFLKLTTAKAEIELSFLIRKDGSVSSIKVIQSADKLKDKEAIRLLKDGPKWIFVPNEANQGQIKFGF
ncbi:MAG: carboxypeptidase-like regulatory domain-containing protein [Flavobacterium sp.]|nr:MAG: carboxypeptidase-like regulatory domain-containing protein [Flavobacterium sp.]